jgi:hypothetical protein
MEVGRNGSDGVLPCVEGLADGKPQTAPDLVGFVRSFSLPNLSRYHGFHGSTEVEGEPPKLLPLAPASCSTVGRWCGELAATDATTCHSPSVPADSIFKFLPVLQQLYLLCR